MKYRGTCDSPECRTAHEWVFCWDCYLGDHCADACPVPTPVYIKQVTEGKEEP